jgi:HlyD family secretion protein
MRRWLLIGLVLAVLAGGAWWALAVHGKDDPQRYRTAEVVRGDLAEVITANGTLNPVTVVNVGVQVSGTVQAIHADFNDRVTEGQLLLELDPRLFQARLLQSEANLARARAQVQLAETNRRRAEELLKREFVSGQAYDQAVATAAIAAADVKAAEATVAADRANLAFSVVRAPVSGVVISRQVDVGQTVASSFQTPTLFTIARDLTQMQIEASVAESDISRVRIDQPVTFTVDSFGARRFKGRVQEIRLNPATEQNVVTFKVIIAVANPDGVLLPGMTATARFEVQDFRNVLLVPNAALAFRPADFDARALREANRGKGPAAPGNASETGFPATVFVPGPDGAPQALQVRVGASDDERSVLLSGPLKAGDLVITADLEAKKDGGSPGRPR